VLDQAAVTDEVFQLASQHGFKEDHGVERGLTRVAVEGVGLGM
jgi:hypothetical protein